MAGKFNSAVVSWAIQTNDRMEGVYKEVALEGMKIVKRRSPVKTGRFRANWRMGINSPDLTADEDTFTRSKFGDEPNENELRESRSVLRKLKLKDKVFISNALKYAAKIEGGSSDMAPAGVVTLSHAELQAAYPGIVGRFLTGRRRA